MKYIITEQQYRKLNKSSEAISKAIVKHMNQYISQGSRKVTPKPRNYGNLREDWCINGKETIVAIYFFEKDRFERGFMYVSNQLVESLVNLLSVRKSYVLNTIAEWYDETMVPKFEQIVGESGLGIDDIDTSDRDHECIDEPEIPEGITAEEMIEYVANNTLYSEKEVIEKIESGEETLEDLYLHIVDIQNRKKILGF